MAENTIITLTSPDGATLNTAGTYCEGNIEVVPKLQEKTATTGEIVTADAGYVGLESVDTTSVFEAGKKSEYDAFWDVWQEGGRRRNANYMFFGQGWTDITYKPKYPFLAFEYGYNAFSQNNITDTIFPIDYSKMKAIASSVFEGSTRLHTIPKLVLSESVTFVNWFRSCFDLVNLTIEGTIGQNGFDVSWSPLSKASIISIINALSDTTTGLAVTLRLSAIKKAFETSEGANDGDASDEWLQLIATKPNWTINTIDS